MDKVIEKQKRRIPTVRRQIKEAISDPEIRNILKLETQTDIIGKTQTIMDDISERKENQKLQSLTFKGLIGEYLNKNKLGTKGGLLDGYSRRLRRQCEKMGISEFLNKVTGGGKRSVYRRKDLYFIGILDKENQENIAKSKVEAIVQWYKVSVFLGELLERVYKNGYIEDDGEILETLLVKAERNLWKYYELGSIPQDMELMMEYGEFLEYILEIKDSPNEIRELLHSADNKDLIELQFQKLTEDSINFQEFARTQNVEISEYDKQKVSEIAQRLYEIYKANKKKIKALTLNEMIFLCKSDEEASDNGSEIEELQSCVNKIKRALMEQKPTDTDEVLLEWDYISELWKILFLNGIKIPDDLEKMMRDRRKIVFSQILNKYVEWISQKDYIHERGNLYRNYKSKRMASLVPKG